MPFIDFEYNFESRDNTFMTSTRKRGMGYGGEWGAVKSVTFVDSIVFKQ